MKKALFIVSILTIAVISTACINNIAVQELNNKAAEFMQKGDYESAINRLESSLDLDSSMYQTYYNLGVAAINAKKYEKAIDALQKGIKIKSDYPDFYYSLGVAQIELADEYLDPEDDKDNTDFEVQDKKEEKQVSPVEKEKAIALKSAAVDNLKKYLEMSPNPQDKENINEMIKQSEEFISGDEKKASEE